MSCTRAPSPPVERKEVDAKSAASVIVKPYATARPSVTPLWFEFGPNGPVSISGPLDSALTSFDPWPLARRAAGLVVRDGSVTVAVNRDGFVSLVPRKEGEIAVYRVGDATRFAAYSIASVFLYRESPTVLFYRDRFFVDPTENAPDPRACSLLKGSLELVPVDLPVLSVFPVSQSWDIEALGLSFDGRWVMKAVRSGGLSFAAAASLDEVKTDITAAAYRAALLPRSPKDSDGPLRVVLDAAVAELPPKKAMVATVVGAGNASTQTYLLSTSKGDNADAILSASDENVDRVWAYRDASRAFLLLGDGSYFASATGNAEIMRGHLPALPENFVYTGIAAANKTLVVVWEEQDGWAVGSAGFLLVDAGL
ncbi:MAG: hypothetical protein WCT14_18445 [Treponemataceae bacterium]